MAHDVPGLLSRTRPVGDFPGATQSPLDYPGTRPGWSYLYCGDVICPLLTADGVLSVDTSGGTVPLDELLAARGLAPLAARFVTLAVGSNACPGRLREKYGERFPRSLIPALHGWVDGLDSVYCADLAGYAAIPATCVAAPGVRLEAWALLVSAEELDWLNETEGIGVDYDLVQISGPFRCDAGGLGPAYAYTHRRTLALDGVPVRLSDFSAQRSPFVALDQRQILGSVLDRLNFSPGLTLAERHALLWKDAELRAAVVREIAAVFMYKGEDISPGPSVKMNDVQVLKWV